VPVRSDAPFVSHGALPPQERVREVLDDAYRRFLPVDEGEVSTVYPALAKADPDRFGLAVVGVGGGAGVAGDAEVPFTIMSVAKPFTFALVASIVGVDAVRDLIGVNATGLPFNSISAVERVADGRTNPMVNPGAIVTASAVPGASMEERWDTLHDVLSRFAGRSLSLDEATLTSARATNHRNRALSRLLYASGALTVDPDEAVEVYTRQSCLEVTAVDLAAMGATLAHGGVNPQTGERVVDALACRCTLAVMATAGLYETTGDWLYDVGLPGKSGIGGGIVMVSPGKGALGAFSPRLDRAGNSVRGQLAAELLADELGLDLFASEPAG
jgi:glutaminase